jgi:NitT/TauT family transport system permease protein
MTTESGTAASTSALDGSQVRRRVTRRRTAGRVRWWTVLQPIIGMLVFLGVWEAVIRLLHVSVFLVPAPSGIVSKLWRQPGMLVEHTVSTGEEALIGFALAIAVGSLVALLIAYSRVASRVVYPYLVLLQVTPIVAIAPLLTIWFGFGLAPKIVITFLVAFFPITVNLSVGLRSTDPDMLSLMNSLAATHTQTFWKVRVPAALPYLFSSFRIAAPATVVGAVVAEFVSSTTGLGYLIIQAKSSLDTELLFLAILGSAILGMAFFGIVALFETRLLAWHASRQELT